MTAVNWTPSLPTRPGFYWARVPRSRALVGAVVLQVLVKSPRGLAGQRQPEVLCGLVRTQPIALTDRFWSGTMWCGPLEEPQLQTPGSD